MKKNGFSGIAKKILYKVIYPASLYFTVVTLVLYSVGMLLDHDNTNMIPTLRTELLILGFSLVISLANNLFALKKLHIALRVALHYAATAIGFFVLFITASGSKPGTGVSVVFMLAYTAVYAIICIIVFSVSAAKKKASIEKSEYKPIYDKKI